MTNVAHVPQEVLLAEYSAAHSSFHHYDGFRWQAGAMLIGSSLVLWGFLLAKNPSLQTPAIAVAGLLISVLMATWALFANHYRQLYMSKLHRIHEIETLLGMSLNRNHGFLGLTPNVYPKFGPKGHHLDSCVFVTISMFGPVITIVESGFSIWLLAPLVPVALASLWVFNNERRMVREYSRAVPGTGPLAAPGLTDQAAVRPG